MPARKKGTDASTGSPAEAPALDVDVLRQIVELLETSEVTQLKWTNGVERLSIRRGPLQGSTTIVQAASAPPIVEYSSPVVTRPAPVSTATSGVEGPAKTAANDTPAVKPGNLVTSPFVGNFYRTPAPDQPAFVDVGSVVKKGQVLCIVEAMKLMNEIESDVAGRVVEVLAQSGQPVEYGQPLFRIEPA